MGSLTRESPSFVGQQSGQAQRSPALVEALQSTEQALSELNDAVDSLMQRLSPAMRPCRPTPSDTPNAKQAENPVKLVAIVEQLTGRTDYVTGRLRDMLDRLEL